jgi:hypothetical protein
MPGSAEGHWQCKGALIPPTDAVTVCDISTLDSTDAISGIEKRSVSMALTGRDMIEAARQAVAKIPNDRLQSQLTSGASVVVLDVREKEEWDAGHIPQGTFLPRGRLEGRIEELVPDKNTPIVTH